MNRYINKDFNNLPQRSLSYFLATFPSFTPIYSDEVNQTEQYAAYRYILSIYENLYDNPMLLKLKEVPDDALEDWQPQKEKPKLASIIRGTIRKVNTLLQQFHNDILNDNQISQDIQRITSDKIPIEGLKLLAQVKEDNYIFFSRAIFNPVSPWSSELFGSMFENKLAFDKLLDFLEKNGYLRVDNKDLSHGISLDYIKSYGSPEDKLKWAWAERTRAGIELIFEETKKNQPLLSMRIPYYKEILTNIDSMSEVVRYFVVKTSKECNNCRYCVQTDKSGKRPLSYISIDNKAICPLFCGFHFRWKTIDTEIVDNIIGLLQHIDVIFEDRKI